MVLTLQKGTNFVKELYQVYQLVILSPYTKCDIFVGINIFKKLQRLSELNENTMTPNQQWLLFCGRPTC